MMATRDCPVGKEKFYGAKKEAPEMTTASANPLDPAQLSTLIDKIRGCRQRIEPEESSVKLLSDAEIDELTEKEKTEYAKQLTAEHRKLKEAKVRKRVITEAPDYQVYIRYTPGRKKIYIGSSKVGLLDDPKEEGEDLNNSNEEQARSTRAKRSRRVRHEQRGAGAFDTSNEDDGSGDESEPAPAKKMRH